MDSRSVMTEKLAETLCDLELARHWRDVMRRSSRPSQRGDGKAFAQSCAQIGELVERAKALGADERQIVGSGPRARPAWMTREQYTFSPERLADEGRIVQDDEPLRT